MVRFASNCGLKLSPKPPRRPTPLVSSGTVLRARSGPVQLSYNSARTTVYLDYLLLRRPNIEDHIQIFMPNHPVPYFRSSMLNEVCAYPFQTESVEINARSGE